MKNKTLLRYYTIGAFAVAVLTAVAHSFVYLNHYDFIAGLWQKGTSSFWGGVSYLLLIPTVMLALLYALTLKKAEGEEKVTANPFQNTLLTKIATVLAASGLVLTLLAQFLSIGSLDKLSALLNPSSDSYLALTATLHILTLVMALPAAVYFLAFFFDKGERVPLGLCVIGYFVFYTLRVYFDMTLHINNPRWSFRVVTLLLLLLYFVLEVHQHIRSDKRMPYAVVGFLAMTLAFVEGVTNFVMAIGFYTSDGWELLYSAMLLMVAFYIASRFLTMISSLDKAPEPATISETPDEAPEPVAVDDSAASDGDIDDTDDAVTEDGFEELTQDELKRFYEAVYRTVANKRGIGEDASDEDKAAVRKETMAMIAHLLDGDSRRENIAYMREFLRRVEG